ncbi:DUF222 domain-containing protein [Actinomycetospora cinnamomea]|uniref:Uncharacterized protein DUF222 n=1 Tax=Actinomycetospora cinnamomea TaxID=663609 RepID=A0A2U1FRC9_9PSEU|nr:DUF222 domain-containing protein [Actinomycetospora cinnamomea]PVZ14728.1 uncharacterized protein DUF222 [Actinomycetospora cinnamomea]
MWGEAEVGLAQAATRLSPRGLEKVAARLLAYLDPDGVAPDEREARHDEVRLVSRRDGTLWMTAVIADAVGAEILREGFGPSRSSTGCRGSPPTLDRPWIDPDRQRRPGGRPRIPH